MPLGNEELKYLAGFESLAKLVLVNVKSDVTGKGLANLSGLANLRSLFLGCRSISPEGLAHLSRMTYLNELDLDIPELDHIEFLRQFTRLTRLTLMHTAITDDDLANIAGLKQLDGLGVSYAQIGDEGLRHVAGLSNLFSLELSHTRITDAGLDQLPSLSKCMLLDIQGTAVTRVGEARLRAKYPAMRILR